MVALGGCGYRMIGAGSLPGGVETIAINVLENRTSESGLETQVTDALITELNRRKQNSVAQVNQAQAVLNGTIDSLDSKTVARKGTQTSLERRVRLQVSLDLTQKDGKRLWKGKGLAAEQTYLVSSDNSVDTEANRKQAIDLATQRLAENVVRRLTDDF
jgi:hypothetical protein